MFLLQPESHSQFCNYSNWLEIPLDQPCDSLNPNISVIQMHLNPIPICRICKSSDEISQYVLDNIY